MKKVLLGLTAVLALTVAHGQIMFQETIDGGSYDFGASILQTSNGHYIIGGNTYVSSNNPDAYLVKINSNGNLLWTKTYGGTDNDYVSFVQQTSDGGYIIAGITLSFGAGNYDLYLIKTNSSGNISWQRTYGGTEQENLLFNSVRQTNDGGYVIAGYTKSFGAGNFDVYLIKTKTNGDTLWTKTYGGINDDVASTALQTTDGGYIIVGKTVSFGIGIDIYLIKTDSNGNLLWNKTLGGIGQDEGYDIQSTPDGGYIITAQTHSFGAGGSDICIIKIDSNGNALWTKTYGGTGFEQGYTSLQTGDGGYIISARTESFSSSPDFYLIKTDSAWVPMWSKTYGGTKFDEGTFIQKTNDGGYIITGGSNSFGLGTTDIYLVKTDSNGNTGCNEGNPTTISTSPTVITSSPSPIVSSGGIVGNPTMQTGSGGLVTTLCSTFVAINEITSKTSFYISPNPCSAQTTLHSDHLLHNATLTVDNCFGQMVAQIKNISGQTVIFSRDNLASGLYFIRLTEENPDDNGAGKTIAVEKLIITDK